jgi:hypothetical protein
MFTDSAGRSPIRRPFDDDLRLVRAVGFNLIFILDDLIKAVRAGYHPGVWGSLIDYFAWGELHHDPNATTIWRVQMELEAARHVPVNFRWGGRAAEQARTEPTAVGALLCLANDSVDFGVGRGPLLECYAAFKEVVAIGQHSTSHDSYGRIVQHALEGGSLSPNRPVRLVVKSAEPKQAVLVPVVLSPEQQLLLEPEVDRLRDSARFREAVGRVDTKQVCEWLQESLGDFDHADAERELQSEVSQARSARRLHAEIRATHSPVASALHPTKPEGPFDRKSFRWKGEVCERLTPLEYSFVEYFWNNGKPLAIASYEELLERVWGTTRAKLQWDSMRTYVWKLNKKLNEDRIDIGLEASSTDHSVGADWGGK